jgi:hypothetical protein
VPGAPGAPEAPGTPGAPVTPGAPTPGTPGQGALPGGPAGGAGTTGPAEATPARSGAPAELSLVGPAAVQVEEEFEVALDAAIHDAIRALPLAIRFDPQVLTLLDASPGAQAQASGVQAVSPRLDAATGRLDIELQAAADKPFAGAGRLLSLRFVAKTARAQTRIALGQVTLRSGDGVRSIARPPTLLVRVTQSGQ